MVPKRKYDTNHASCVYVMRSTVCFHTRVGVLLFTQCLVLDELFAIQFCKHKSL